MARQGTTSHDDDDYSSWRRKRVLLTGGRGD